MAEFRQPQAPLTTSGSSRGYPPRIVIVGGGFGGLEVAKALGKAGIGATLIDRRNHHLFQPLLYQVATAALSAPDIAEPIRSVLSRYRTIQVLFGEVVGINIGERNVLLSDGIMIEYDVLVVAAGSRSFYFGNGEWADIAPGLKTIEDARKIRSRLLLAFEQAERTIDPREQARLMTIAVIGGGPTGVEMAGSIAELSRHTLARDFRNISPKATRVLLVEAGERLLASFAPDLSDYAQRGLEKLGVEVMLGKRVEALEQRNIMIGGDVLPVGLTVWAAGVAASPLAKLLGVPTDRSGRIEVSPTLEVLGSPSILALGDIARFTNADGSVLPGLAQVAKQQGIHLGRGLAQYVRTGAPLTAFVYRSRGNTAIVGRHAAVFETSRRRLKGWFAWAAWAIIHVYLLVGFQHRVQVSIQWLWRYLTYQRGARLITDEAERVSRPDSRDAS